MTLFCSVAGIFLAKLPYVNLIGALVIALLLGIALQVTPQSVQTEAKSGIGFYLQQVFEIRDYFVGLSA